MRLCGSRACGCQLFGYESGFRPYRAFAGEHGHAGFPSTFTRGMRAPIRMDMRVSVPLLLDNSALVRLAALH